MSRTYDPTRQQQDFNRNFEQEEFHQQNRFRNDQPQFNDPQWNQQGYNQQGGNQNWNQGWNQQNPAQQRGPFSPQGYGGYGQQNPNAYNQQGNGGYGQQFNQQNDGENPFNPSSQNSQNTRNWQNYNQGQNEANQQGNYSRQNWNDQNNQNNQNWNNQRSSQGAFGSQQGSSWGQQGQYAGRGPRNFRRNDQRIEEEVCENLARHPYIDATEVTVTVKEGDVTLAGAVDSRQSKRLAEDISENIFGVREVHNQLRVQQQNESQGNESRQQDAKRPAQAKSESR